MEKLHLYFILFISISVLCSIKVSGEDVSTPRNPIIDLQLNGALKKLRAHMHEPIDILGWPTLDPLLLLDHYERNLDLIFLNLTVAFDNTKISNLSDFQFRNLTTPGAKTLLVEYLTAVFEFSGVDINTDISINANFMGKAISISGPLEIQLHGLHLNLSVQLAYVNDADLRKRYIHLEGLRFHEFDFKDLKVYAGTGELSELISKAINFLVEDFRLYSENLFIKPGFDSLIETIAILLLNNNYMNYRIPGIVLVGIITKLNSLP